MPQVVKQNPLISKKFKSKKQSFKVWLTVLPFILLLVGLAAAALLLGTNSDLRQQAAGFVYTPCTKPGEKQCSTSAKEVQTCVGGVWQSTPCNTNEACYVIDGVPKCDLIGGGLCTGYGYRCTGNALEQCNGSKWQVVKICGSGLICSLDTHNSGVGGSLPGCVPNCPNIGETTCSNHDRSVTECTDHGWVNRDCPKDQVCVDHSDMGVGGICEPTSVQVNNGAVGSVKRVNPANMAR